MARYVFFLDDPAMVRGSMWYMARKSPQASRRFRRAARVVPRTRVRRFWMRIHKELWRVHA